jgi:predicted dehydrogenase
MALRISLVGAGRWGSNIARALKELEREKLVELDYVIDKEITRASELREKFGFKKASSSLDDIASDAVVVATSIDGLYSTALRAVDVVGCVFVEKPAATSSLQLVELLNRAETKNVVHQVGYISRFDAAITELRKWLEKYPPYAIRFRRLSRRPSHMAAYPVTLDLMSHDVDLAFYLLKPRTTKVFSSMFTPSEGIPQRAVALVSYDGVDAILEADGQLPVKVREIDVLSESGLLRADLATGRLVIGSPSDTLKIEVKNEEPLKKELKVFVERCLGRDFEAPTLRDALAVLKLLEEVHTFSKIISQAG